MCNNNELLNEMYEELVPCKNAEMVHIRSWFPVIHSGYFAIIGFNSETNDYFMSEPIIYVYDSGRIFRSPRKFYFLEGEINTMTLDMFHMYIHHTVREYVDSIAKRVFENCLINNWIENMYYLNEIIVQAQERHTMKVARRFNDSYKEILNPIANYYITKNTDKKTTIANCLQNVFLLICKDKPWKELLVTALKNNGYDHLVPMVMSFEITKTSSHKDQKNKFKAVYLWNVSKQKIASNEYILRGFVYDNNKDFVKFNSRIRQVFNDGHTVQTDAGLVKLNGPMSKLEYERSYNIIALESILGDFLYRLIYGLPKYWEHFVTIIDMVLAMDIVASDL